MRMTSLTLIALAFVATPALGQQAEGCSKTYGERMGLGWCKYRDYTLGEGTAADPVRCPQYIYPGESGYAQFVVKAKQHLVGRIAAGYPVTDAEGNTYRLAGTAKITGPSYSHNLRTHHVYETKYYRSPYFQWETTICANDASPARPIAPDIPTTPEEVNGIPETEGPTVGVPGDTPESLPLEITRFIGFRGLGQSCINIAHNRNLLESLEGYTSDQIIDVTVQGTEFMVCAPWTTQNSKCHNEHPNNRHLLSWTDRDLWLDTDYVENELRFSLGLFPEEHLISGGIARFAKICLDPTGDNQSWEFTMEVAPVEED